MYRAIHVRYIRFHEFDGLRRVTGDCRRKPIVLSNNYHLFPFYVWVWHVRDDVGGPPTVLSQLSQVVLYNRTTWLSAVSGHPGWPSLAQ